MEEFNQYKQHPAWVINGQVFTIESYAQQASQMANQQYEMAIKNAEMLKQAVDQGQASEEQYAQVVNSPRTT